MVGLGAMCVVSNQVGVSAVVFQCLFAELEQFMMEGKTMQVQMKIDEATTGERAGLTILRTPILGLSAAAVADMDVAASAYRDGST